MLLNSSGKPAAEAAVKLHSTTGGRHYAATSGANGKFPFGEIAGGTYELSATISGKEWKAPLPLVITDGTVLTMSLQMSSSGQELRTVSASAETATQANGGEHLSTKEVSSLPLHARDFSKLLLLAAGTMTDANGAANFTQQFAVNGQRGSAHVWCFSDDCPRYWPAPHHQEELGAAFKPSNGWTVATTEPDRIETRYHDDGALVGSRQSTQVISVCAQGLDWIRRGSSPSWENTGGHGASPERKN